MRVDNSFDPSVLFEKQAFWVHPPKRQPYPTDEAELDAVASRRKAMSMYSWTRDYLRTREFAWVTKQVLDRGLMLVLDPDESNAAVPQLLQGVQGFILHHDQAWRIPAYRVLWETAFESGRWSDSAEAQMSLLLGYTKAERRAWLEQQRWRQAAWGCVTAYTLLTAEQRAAVETLGRRCFGQNTMTLIHHAELHLMKRNASALVPKHLTIARVGIERGFAGKLLGYSNRRKRTVIVSTTVSASRAKSLNAALRSNVQFLGPKGWR